MTASCDAVLHQKVYFWAMRRFAWGVWISVAWAQVSLLQRADSLVQTGQLDEALALYDSVLQMSEVSDSLRMWVLIRQAEALTQQGQSPDTAFAQAERIALRNRDTLAQAIILARQAARKAHQGDFQTAYQLAVQARLLMEQANKVMTPEYMELVLLLGRIGYMAGRYEEMLGLFLTAKNHVEQGPPSVQGFYLRILSGLGNFYWVLGQYKEALDIQRTVLGTLEATGDTTSPMYALSLNNLGLVLSAVGRKEECARLYQKAIDILRVAGMSRSPLYINLLNNLGVAYRDIGSYGEAEQIFLETARLRAEVYGMEHPEYAISLNNLIGIYIEENRLSDAERTAQQAGQIWKAAFGESHPEYAMILSTLANVYQTQQRFAEAESLILQSLAIYRQIYPETHPVIAAQLNNLANAYMGHRDYVRAESLHKAAAEIRRQTPGPESNDYAFSLNNLGLVALAQKRYTEAESLLYQSLRIRHAVMGEYAVEYFAHALYDIIKLYTETKRYREADSLWQRYFQLAFYRLRRDFAALPAAYRQTLLSKQLQSAFKDFQAYVAQHPAPPEALILLGYRVARTFKGLLLSSSEGARYLIERSKDSTVQTLYKEWNALLDIYGALYHQEQYQAADSVWKLAAETERQIQQRLPDLLNFIPDFETEVELPRLARRQVAIELVRVPITEIDSIAYLFYLLSPSSQGTRLTLHIRMVSSAWEERTMNVWNIYHTPGAPLSGMPYKLLWSFVDSILPKGVKTVYLSPDGIYHLINPEALYDAEHKRFVGDVYVVRYLASTRRLLRRSASAAQTTPSAVIGNQAF